MREVISLHVGQAGVQIGSTCWELYLMEHGLTSEGYQMNPSDEKSNMLSLFSETSKGHYVPRSLFVDFEPTVIDTIRQGEFSRLYNPEFMITGKEDSSDNYARGYYSIGRQHIENAESKYRRLAENCDSLQGILLFRSYGGGTGSGFSSLLVERIQDSLGKKCKLEFAICPSPDVSTSIVEPYNSVLTPHVNDVCFMMDNQAVFDLCREKLDVEWPNYYNLNRLVAQAVSSFTGSLRFDGSLNVDLNEFQTNLVPFPSVRFPIVSMAPLISKERIAHTSYNTSQVVNEVFEEKSQFVKCNVKQGLYMSCCLLFRGDFEQNSSSDINKAITNIKTRKDTHFVDWMPTGFKVGLNSNKPRVFPDDDMAEVSRSCVMLSNSTSVQQPWQRLIEKFQRMFRKRAFVHWYVGEGLEESEFDVALGSVHDLIQEYQELTSDNTNDDDDSY